MPCCGVMTLQLQQINLIPKCLCVGGTHHVYSGCVDRPVARQNSMTHGCLTTPLHFTCNKVLPLPIPSSPWIRQCQQALVLVVVDWFSSRFIPYESLPSPLQVAEALFQSYWHGQSVYQVTILGRLGVAWSMVQSLDFIT